MNDLPAVVKQSQIASFANDTKLLFKSIQLTLDTQLLQEDLSSLEHWSISSRLKFNQEKCKFLRVTKKSNPIEQQSYKICPRPAVSVHGTIQGETHLFGLITNLLLA